MILTSRSVSYSCHGARARGSVGRAATHEVVDVDVDVVVLCCCGWACLDGQILLVHAIIGRWVGGLLLARGQCAADHRCCCCHCVSSWLWLYSPIVTSLCVGCHVSVADQRKLECLCETV